MTTLMASASMSLDGYIAHPDGRPVPSSAGTGPATSRCIDLVTHLVHRIERVAEA